MRDERGVASVYLACRNVLAKTVRRIVGSHEVEDILQEAFVRTFEAGERTVIRDTRAFLLRTATNLAFNHVTRAGHRLTGSMEGIGEELLVDDSIAPDVQVDADRRFLTFCRAVGALPDQCRRVFVLRKVHGLSQEEIATQLGIAESTVEKHIAKGLLLCRQHMLQEAVPLRHGSTKRIA